MAQGAGLWLDADVLLLKPVEIDPAKPYFAWERPRQLGNSVLYLPPDDSIVAAFENLMEQEGLTPDWLALRHRLTFTLRKLGRRIEPALRHPHRDLRPAIAHRARPAAAARSRTPCRSNRSMPCMPSTKLFFGPSDFSKLIADPEIIGFHISPKGRGSEQPLPGSLYAWAENRFSASPFQRFPGRLNAWRPDRTGHRA